MKAEVISKIPFDNVVTEALVHGVPVVEYSDGEVSKEIAKLWTIAAKIL
jgi:MinD superfamily P-loop ATPase